MLRALRQWVTSTSTRATRASPRVGGSGAEDSDVTLLDPSAVATIEEGESRDDDDALLDLLSDEPQPLVAPVVSTPPGSVSTATVPSVIEQPDPRADPRHAASRRERAQRHRSRRHHRHHRGRLCRCKRKESNMLGAMCNMVAVVLVCTALAEPEWVYVSGGRCRDAHNLPLSYLGVKLFFYQGSFSSNPHAFTPPPPLLIGGGRTPPPSELTPPPQSVYRYGSEPDDVLLDCVNVSVVFVMRSIIVACMLALLLSLTAFVIDLVGPTHRVPRTLRYNSIFAILAVCLCVVVNGLTYLLTEQLRVAYQALPYRFGSRVDVQFSLSFYIVTAAGVMSVLAAACNLFQRPSLPSEGRGGAPRGGSGLTGHDRLLADLQAADAAAGGAGFSACCQLSILPSPPPYSP